MIARKTSQLIGDRDDLLDYDEVMTLYPWLLDQSRNCIISPDADGILCALLLSHFADWRIRGFYDGTHLAIEPGVDQRDCVFLDMEIFRAGFMSIGNHMLLYRSADIDDEWRSRFGSCFSVNNHRSCQFDGSFSLKYPFATIHLLLALVSRSHAIEVSRSSIDWLLFADGSFQNLFRYPENCADWLRYLRTNEDWNPLRTVFHGEEFDLHETMTFMLRVWKKRDDAVGYLGDKLDIFKKQGGMFANLRDDHGAWVPAADALQRWESFIRLVSDDTEWNYDPARWCWSGLDIHPLQKESIARKKALPIGVRMFRDMLVKKPVSWILPAKHRLDYTLDPNGVFQ